MAKSIQSSKTVTVKFSTLSSSRSSRGHNPSRKRPARHSPARRDASFSSRRRKFFVRFLRREKKLHALEWIYVRLSLRAFSSPVLLFSSHLRGSTTCFCASRRAAARSGAAAPRKAKRLQTQNRSQPSTSRSRLQGHRQANRRDRRAHRRTRSSLRH